MSAYMCLLYLIIGIEIVKIGFCGFFGFCVFANNRINKSSCTIWGIVFIVTALIIAIINGIVSGGFSFAAGLVGEYSTEIAAGISNHAKIYGVIGVFTKIDILISIVMIILVNVKGTSRKKTYIEDDDNRY